MLASSLADRALGSVYIDMSMLPMVIMDGRHVNTWKSDHQSTPPNAVVTDYEDFKAHLWAVEGGFAWVHAYPDTGTFESWDNPELLPVLGALLASAEAHATESLGKLTVTSDCIGIVPRIASATHVTDADVAAGAKAFHEVQLDALDGNLVLVPVPNGTYEVTSETLSAEGVLQHPEIGKVMVRYRCRRVD